MAIVKLGDGRQFDTIAKKFIEEKIEDKIVLEELKTPEELEVHPEPKSVTYFLAGKSVELSPEDVETYKNLLRKLNESQNGRDISEIPLSDSYYGITKQLESFINSH